MECPKCGGQLTEQMLFCGQCGEPIPQKTETTIDEPFSDANTESKTDTLEITSVYEEKKSLKLLFVFNSVFLGVVALMWILMPAYTEIEYGISYTLSVISWAFYDDAPFVVYFIPMLLGFAFSLSFQYWDKSFVQRRHRLIISILCTVFSLIIGCIIMLLFIRNEVLGDEFAITILFLLTDLIIQIVASKKEKRLLKKLL